MTGISIGSRTGAQGGTSTVPPTGTLIGRATGIPRRTAIAALGLITALTLTSCRNDVSGADNASEASPGASLAGTQYRLASFTGCDDVLAKLRAAGQAAVGPYGFPGSGVMVALTAPDRGPGVPAPQPAAPGLGPDGGGGPAQPHSGTNDQEVGVDEPDLVKTDGHRIVTVTHGVLRVVDAATRKQAGTLRLPNASPFQTAEILLAGDRALIITASPDRKVVTGPVAPITGVAPAGPVDGAAPAITLLPAPLSAPSTPFMTGGVRLTLVGLSGAPAVLATYDFDGVYLDARQTGGTARIVVRSTPRVMFPYHQRLNDEQRVEANRKIVAKSTLDDWLPHFTSTTAATPASPDGATISGHVPCGAVTHPGQYSGTNMVTVLSFDLAASGLGNGLGNGDPITVVADGDTVYASTTSLYVASDQRWRLRMPGPIPVLPKATSVPAPPKATSIPAAPAGPAGKPTSIGQPIPRPVTEIYRFDLAHPGTPRFAGGGSVPGYLLNQYAMSEWHGVLRVAATLGRGSSVHTLSIADGDGLRPLGHIDGLGHNQQLYAVRFLGAFGYVVTFRQVDPLYVIDLSDPRHPVEAGSLEMPGYSAYLHPVDATHLVGVGQAADAKGHVLGVQVSLFDIGNPSAPKLAARATIPNSGSSAERDPHAFLYWPATGLLVIPVSTYASGSAGAYAFHIGLGAGSESVTAVGHVTHHGNDPVVRRSLVIGNTLWTLSSAGLMASDLNTLDQEAWIPF